MTYPVDLFERYAPRPAGFIDLDPTEIEGSIGARFEKMVSLYPDRIAYEDDGGLRLTYAEVNASANRIARHLLDRDAVRPNTVVLLLFTSPARAIISSLALFKCGGTTVVLDDTYPQARIEHMIADSGANLLLTERDSYPLAQSFSLPSGSIMTVEDILDASHEEGNPGVDIAPQTYSHILYTSGSTGEPKGMLHAHNTVLHLVCYLTQVYAYSAADRVPLFSSIVSADSLETIYAALLNGGTVLPYHIRSRGLGDLPGWMRDTRATVLSANPTTIRSFDQLLDADDRFPDVRLVSVGGETIRYDDLMLYQHRFPDSTVGFNYGTSEALWVTACFLSHKQAITGEITVPAGYVFGQHEVLLLDDDRQPVPEGDIGEFAIRSRYLSPGYWRNPDLNRTTFVADGDDPLKRLYLSGDLGRRVNGSLYIHLGRKDDQIKVRGFRIEPGDTESALLSIDGVREAVVAGRQDQTGETFLVAYIVAGENAILLADHLRHALAQRLPDFLIPARFVLLDALPRTSSGKVDRHSLPEHGRERPDLSTPYAPPRTDLEARVAAIWASELNLDRVGIHDNFLDLGGHSLLATQLIYQVSETMGLTVGYEALFDAPTIAQMAALLEQMLPYSAADHASHIGTQPRDAFKVNRKDLEAADNDGNV